MKWPLFLFLILPMLSFGQNKTANKLQPNIQPTYADAVYLAELEQKFNDPLATDFSLISNEIKGILIKYNVDINASESTQNKLLAELIDYTKGYLPTVDKFNLNKGSNIGGSTGTKKANLPEAVNPANALGFGWEAAAINGLSTFMANRFKQETIHFGLNRLFNQIKEKDAKIFNALLPDTYKEICSLQYSNNYYSADLVFLRQVVDNDLEKIHYRIAKDVKNVFPRIPDEGADILKIAANIHSDLGTGLTLPGMFSRLDKETYYNATITKAITLNHLFSEALRDIDGSEGTWVDIHKLKSPTSGQKVGKFFFGLLMEQLKPFIPSDNQDENLKKINQLITYFEDLNSAAVFLKKNNFNLNVEQGLQLLNMLQTSISTLIKTGDELEILPYSSEYLIQFSNYQDFASSLVKRDYQKALITILKQMINYLPEEQVTTYRRSLIFMVQLAETKNDMDMEQLLEAYALPIGGSSIKRNSNFNVSLNGYVGLTAGNEIAYGSENQAKTNIGLAAPIGVSINFNKNFTVFASIIDLGTLVNVRLNNDTTFFSNLKFEHFLAPGIGLYYNFKKSPITLGAHYNYIPNLRTIKIGNGEAAIAEKNISVSRFNVSLLVDIPFFTLYNK